MVELEGSRPDRGSEMEGPAGEGVAGAAGFFRQHPGNSMEPRAGQARDLEGHHQPWGASLLLPLMGLCPSSPRLPGPGLFGTVLLSAPAVGPMCTEASKGTKYNSGHKEVFFFKL